MSTPGSNPGKLTLLDRFSLWSAKHPVTAIVAVSLLAVVINCYPILFCGRSFVAPIYRTPMVYSWWPSLPGMPAATPQVESHGSDTAAAMWWGVPAGFIESRSLWEYGELPLWNRYSHAGDTFIGQAITMLGDPLQLIVIFGRGSALAWDIKFLVAKFLFCVGFGLLVRRLSGNGPLSLIFAALAAWCGTFFYINNHPIFFVFCYAPWILFSAIAWLDLRSTHSMRWISVWLLADFACFNGGDIEAAVVLIGGLNLAALALALASHRGTADRIKVIGRMAMGTLLFAGLTAPIWMSFLGALEGSYSAHAAVRVIQLPLRCLPDIFESFFSALTPLPPEALLSETGLLVLVGCVLSLAKWKQLQDQPFFWINSGAIVLWSGCIFGWVPASLLIAVPFLNRIGHLYMDVAFLLAIHLMIQSAYGFICLAGDKNPLRTALVLLGTAIALESLVIAGGGLIHRPVPWNYFMLTAAAAIGAPMLFAFLKSLQRQTQTAGWAGIIVLGLIAHHRFGLYTFGNNEYLLLPGPRVVLNAPSPAVDRIKAGAGEPFRAIGFKWNFTGDYSAVYGIEDIRSCAPLSNPALIDLVRDFPGMQLSQYWVIEVLDPVRAQPLLNLFNVRYLLGSPRVNADAPGFRVVDRLDFGIVENLDAWPRAFFTDKIVSIPSNDAFIHHLTENAGQPFAAIAPDDIQADPALQLLTAKAKATVVPATGYRLFPNSTSFDVHAPSAGMVCLTEGQAKDFVALANHEPKPVLTVNRMFKGVYLDKPGDYHLEFIYRPHHWRLACLLFWLAIGAVIVLAAAESIRRKKKFKTAG